MANANRAQETPGLLRYQVGLADKASTDVGIIATEHIVKPAVPTASAENPPVPEAVSAPAPEDQPPKAEPPQ